MEPRVSRLTTQVQGRRARAGARNCYDAAARRPLQAFVRRDHGARGRGICLFFGTISPAVEVPRLVKKSEDLHLSALHLIDESKGANKEFPKEGLRQLRNRSATGG